MRYLFFTFITILLFVSCKHAKQDKGYLPVINILSLNDQASLLSISDVADIVEYIPLETNDSVLIHSDSDVFLYEDLIFITSKKQGLMLFDRNSGKYIRPIGRIGQGPEEYSVGGFGFSNNVSYSFDEVTKTIYFHTHTAGVQIRYDLEGNFLGRTAQAQHAEYNSTFHQIIHNDTVTAHNNIPLATNNVSVLSFHAKTGNLKDTIPQFKDSNTFSYDNVRSFSVLKASYTTDRKLTYIFTMKTGEYVYFMPKSPSLWKWNNKIRLKEAFVDTIYTIKESSLQPIMTLNLGKYHWPYKQRFDNDVSKDKLYVDYILENEELLYIHLCKSLYENPEKFIALYDKKTGETRVMKNKEGLKDDITNFIPMRIQKVSSTGSFVSLVEAVDVFDRVKELGNEGLHSSLQHLKQVKEDDNPIIVIARRKK